MSHDHSCTLGMSVSMQGLHRLMRFVADCSNNSLPLCRQLQYSKMKSLTPQWLLKRKTKSAKLAVPLHVIVYMVFETDLLLL